MKPMNLIAKVDKIMGKTQTYDEAVEVVARKLMIPVRISSHLVNEVMHRTLNKPKVCAILKKEKA